MIPVAIVFVLAAYIVAAANASLSALIALGPARPDFALVAIIAVGLHMRSENVPVFMGFAMGLVADCFHPATLGLGAFLGATAGFLAVSFRQRLALESPPAHAIFTFVISLAVGAVEVSTQRTGGVGQTAWLVLAVAATGALYTGLLSLPLFLFLGRPKYGSAVR